MKFIMGKCEGCGKGIPADGDFTMLGESFYHKGCVPEKWKEMATEIKGQRITDLETFRAQNKDLFDDKEEVREFIRNADIKQIVDRLNEGTSWLFTSVLMEEMSKKFRNDSDWQSFLADMEEVGMLYEVNRRHVN